MVWWAGHRMLHAKKFQIPAAHTRPYSEARCLLACMTQLPVGLQGKWLHWSSQKYPPLLFGGSFSSFSVTWFVAQPGITGGRNFCQHLVKPHYKSPVFSSDAHVQVRQKGLTSLTLQLGTSACKPAVEYRQMGEPSEEGLAFFKFADYLTQYGSKLTLTSNHHTQIIQVIMDACTWSGYFMLSYTGATLAACTERGKCVLN